MAIVEVIVVNEETVVKVVIVEKGRKVNAHLNPKEVNDHLDPKEVSGLQNQKGLNDHHHVLQDTIVNHHLNKPTDARRQQYLKESLKIKDLF